MIREFDRSFEALDAVFDYSERFFEDNDVDTQTAFAIKLAIEEVFTNFVKYNSESTEPLQVDLELDGDSVRVTLVDPDTHPFDVAAFGDADTSSSLQDRTPGGLGIYLVKRMVDSLQYDHTERQSTIVLTKKMSR